jgi:hypothetical protein
MFPQPDLLAARHVRKSSDGGMTWQELPLVVGFERRKLALTPARPGMLFFSGAGQHVFAAKADGTIIADLDAVPTTASSLMFDPKEPDVLYAGGVGGLYRRKLP